MKELDKVILPDGRIGYILEVLNDGEAYLVEFESPAGPDKYDDAVFKHDELGPAVEDFRLCGFGAAPI